MAEQIFGLSDDGRNHQRAQLPRSRPREAPRRTPWVKLAEMLGSFAGQLTEDPIKGVRIV